MSPSGKTTGSAQGDYADHVYVDHQGMDSAHSRSGEDAADFGEARDDFNENTPSAEHDGMDSGAAAEEPAADEPIVLEELEEFAAYFKQKRIQLGFTQGDVGLAMGRLYGNDFSQTTVSRFEALNLSFKNMCKLKPLLEKWLNDVEAAVEKGTFSREILRTQPPPAEIVCAGVAKRRKKRTSIDGNLRQVLEEVFSTNPRPSMETMLALASTLDMDRNAVRVWFCNRRQKERRQHPGVVFPDELPGVVERFKAAAAGAGLECLTVHAPPPPIPSTSQLKQAPKRHASKGPRRSLHLPTTSAASPCSPAPSSTATALAIDPSSRPLPLPLQSNLSLVHLVLPILSMQPPLLMAAAKLAGVADKLGAAAGPGDAQEDATSAIGIKRTALVRESQNELHADDSGPFDGFTHSNGLNIDEDSSNDSTASAQFKEEAADNA